MSTDFDVRAALRSSHPLVVVEAPAGCGKTHQGADLAEESASSGEQRTLILTHTHAACSVFADRTARNKRVEIRTVDSLVAQIASVYHKGLGLPLDAANWARTNEEGHARLALKVAPLLRNCQAIGEALARRYPLVICDEHQDCSGDQHSLAMAMLNRGSRVRIFGDPVQRIFKEPKLVGATGAYNWDELTRAAHTAVELENPHRWADGSSELGQWTLEARKKLKSGDRIDLRGPLPEGLTVVRVENISQRYLGFSVSSGRRSEIDRFVARHGSLLILTHYNEMASSLLSFFNRRIPLWEGHTRNALEQLVRTIVTSSGQPLSVGRGMTTFLEQVATGLSPSSFGGAFERELSEECQAKRRGKPAAIQKLARFVLQEADHHGVAKALQTLLQLQMTDSGFRDVAIDHPREYRDAIRLGEYPDGISGLTEITNRRTFSRPKPPTRVISTVHKAKGLECDAAIIMPCDGTAFPDKPDARALLYVALSRAKRELLIVVPTSGASPLLIL